MTDERGRVTYNSYAAYGDPAAARLVHVGSPERVVTEYVRNAVGTITAIRHSGLTRYRNRDARQRLTASYDPELGGWTRYSYDAVGRLSAKYAPAGTTSYSYDSLDRLTRTRYPDGQVETFSYDANGNLTTAKNGVATRSFSYDRLDQPSTNTLRIDGRTFTSRVSRDLRSNVSSLRYPSGRTISYSPDYLGRARYAWPMVTSVTRFASGLPSRLSFFNGAVTTQQQDSRHRLVQTTTQKAGLVVADLRYSGYDGLGNPQQVRDLAYAPRNMTQLSYDGVGRLQRALLGIFPGNALEFRYDQRHNLTSASFFNTSIRRDTPVGADQRLLGFGYDRQGNVTSIPSGIAGLDPMSLSFDGAGRLRRASRNGLTVRFDYDATGKLVRQRNGQTTTYHFFDTAGTLLGQYDGSGALLREQVWMDNKLVGGYTPGGGAALHTDRNGSPVVLTAAGATVARVGYFPYGERWTPPDPKRDVVGGTFYAGRLEDPVSGLLYHEARWYHPGLRRFVSPDPIGIREDDIHSTNRYSYASNNPLRFVDPDGHEPIGLDPGEILDEAALRARGVTNPHVSGVANLLDDAIRIDLDGSFATHGRTFFVVAEGAPDSLASRPGASNITPDDLVRPDSRSVEGRDDRPARVPDRLRDRQGGSDGGGDLLPRAASQGTGADQPPAPAARHRAGYTLRRGSVGRVQAGRKDLRYRRDGAHGRCDVVRGGVGLGDRRAAVDRLRLWIDGRLRGARGLLRSPRRHARASSICCHSDTAPKRQQKFDMQRCKPTFVGARAWYVPCVRRRRLDAYARRTKCDHQSCCSSRSSPPSSLAAARTAYRSTPEVISAAHRTTHVHRTVVA